VRLRKTPQIRSRKLPKIVTAGTTPPKLRIYVAWTKMVSSEEVDAVVNGFKKTLEETNHQVLVKFQGTKSFGKGNLDWYQQQALITPTQNFGYGPIFRAENMIWGTFNETLDDYSKHFVVLIVDQDIKAGDLNFVYGSADEGVGFVVSKSRVSDIPNQNLRNLILQRLSSHEMGHVLNVPFIRTNASGHCSNHPCRMNWCSGIDQLLDEERNKIDFCKTCRSDLRNYS